MSSTNPDRNRRILIIDDNKSIHADFRKILSPNEATRAALDVTETALFGNPVNEEQQLQFEIDSPYQGQEAVIRAEVALTSIRPYAMAFIDMRMPPGWDGLKTAQKILEVDPEIQIVICTAYTAYSWSKISEQIGTTDRMGILKAFRHSGSVAVGHELTEKMAPRSS